MPTLKKELGLGDPKSPQTNQGSTEQADKFKAAFQEVAGKINEALRYTAAYAEKIKHDPEAGKRDNSCKAYQAALSRIDPTNPSVAQSAIDQVLAAVKGVKSSAEALRAAAEKAFNEWTGRESSLERITEKITEMVDWGHTKASALQQVVDAIVQKANDRAFAEACRVVDQLATKFDSIYAEYQEQRKAQQEYAPARQELEAKLAESKNCPFKSLATDRQAIEAGVPPVDQAATEKNYVAALPKLRELEAKTSELKAKATALEEKKAAYEQARGPLDQKLLEASRCQFTSLAELDQTLADLTSKTDAAATEEKYDDAIKYVGELSTKVDEKLARVKDLEAKKAEYEVAVQAFQSKLPKACPVDPKLSALDSEITALKGQMESAAGNDDYAKALELAKQVSAKADEFQKALEEFEKKQAYEAALKALQPKLPTQCPVNAGLAERHSQIMTLKGQMEAAATSQDYVKALELAKQLSTKADEYQKALKEKPPSPEKVKEVQDLITAGKKDDAIKKAMEVYGVDKSQAKSIVYDSSVSGEAVASKDGSVKVGDKAFSSPGWLASSTAHELEVHVNQQAKAGKWYTGPMGTAIQEVQAYDHEIANAHKYDLTEAEIKDLKKRRKEHYDLLNADYQKRADAGNYDMKTGEEGL